MDETKQILHRCSSRSNGIAPVLVFSTIQQVLESFMNHVQMYHTLHHLPLLTAALAAVEVMSQEHFQLPYLRPSVYSWRVRSDRETLQPRKKLSSESMDWAETLARCCAFQAYKLLLVIDHGHWSMGFREPKFGEQK